MMSLPQKILVALSAAVILVSSVAMGDLAIQMDYSVEMPATNHNQIAELASGEAVPVDSDGTLVFPETSIIASL